MFADAENPAGVPHCERARAPSANPRNPVARDSRLIVNDGNLPADQAIEQRGLAYVWPADDCDIRHIRLAVHRLKKSFLTRAAGARALRLATGAHRQGRKPHPKRK